MTNKLFHYTDLEAVANIIKTNKMRATHIRFLNDYSELHHGLDLLLDAVAKDAEISTAEKKSIKQDLENNLSTFNVYVSSFSRGEDLLSQWRGYTPNCGGYAIEFDERKLVNNNCRLPIQSQTVGNCLYTLTDKMNVIKSAVRSFNEDYERDIRKFLYQSYFVGYSALMKHEGFSEEKEVRVILDVDREVKISHRFRNGIAVPYIEFSLTDNCIKRVIIGPSNDVELAEIGLRSLLNNIPNGENIEVIRSNVTLKV